MAIELLTGNVNEIKGDVKEIKADVADLKVEVAVIKAQQQSTSDALKERTWGHFAGYVGIVLSLAAIYFAWIHG